MRMLLLLLLLGGAVWCLTTEQGRLAHIKAGAALKVYPPVLNLDIGALDAQLTQAAVQPAFNGVPMECRPETSELGDTACFARISLLNDMPAYSAAFFFRNQRVQAVRLAVQIESGPKLDQYLKQQFGKVIRITTPPRGPGKKPLVRYVLPHGMLMTSQQTSDLDELILLWLPN